VKVRSTSERTRNKMIKRYIPGIQLFDGFAWGLIE